MIGRIRRFLLPGGVAALLAAAALIPLSVHGQFGCTSNGFCVAAHSSCWAQYDWRCGRIQQPNTVTLCGKGTAQHCQMDGDKIEGGTYQQCVPIEGASQPLEDSECEPGKNTGTLDCNACRAW